MAFFITPGVSIDRDDHGRVRGLEHLLEPYTAADEAGVTTGLDLAVEYLRGAATLYEIPEGALARLTEELKREPEFVSREASLLRFAHEGQSQRLTTISFVQ